MTVYTKTGNPPSNMRGVSDLIRAEFALIETAVNSKGDGNFLVLGGTEAQGATVNDYVVTVSPAITTYTTGSVVAFIATHSNTGVVTLKISALTAKTLKDVGGNPLASGDITNGSLVAAYYDGADFFLLSGNDRAAIYSPALTGTPTAPTAIAGTNTNQIATTAHVFATAFSATLPIIGADNGKYLSNNGSVPIWSDASNPVNANDAISLSMSHAIALYF